MKGIKLEGSVISVPPPFPETFSPNLKVPIEKKKPSKPKPVAIGHDSEVGKQSGETSQGRAGQNHLAHDIFVGGFLALVQNCVKLG